MRQRLDREKEGNLRRKGPIEKGQKEKEEEGQEGQPDAGDDEYDESADDDAGLKLRKIKMIERS